MKKLLVLLFFVSLGSLLQAQVINGNGVIVKQSTDIKIEDKSVDAVKEHWRQKNTSDTRKNISSAMANIAKARVARMKNWVDQPFEVGMDLSQYKYMVLLPPRKGHRDIKRNLIKKLKGLPITYVNTQEPYQTHEKMPKEIKDNPESVLWLTVDGRASDLVEIYIQLYNTNGDLIYSMGRAAMSGSSVFKTFKNELNFVYSF